jgi:phage FluMu protein Com
VCGIVCESESVNANVVVNDADSVYGNVIVSVNAIVNVIAIASANAYVSKKVSECEFVNEIGFSNANTDGIANADVNANATGTVERKQHRGESEWRNRGGTERGVDDGRRNRSIF